MRKMFTILLTLPMFAAATASACPTGTTASDRVVEGKRACVLKGTYTDDLYLSNSYAYILEGGVFIGSDNGKGGSSMKLDPATLTIAAGTKVYAMNPQKNGGRDRKDFLVVSRGSKIIAEGTARNPIVFTSLRDNGTGGQRGDWGGLFLNGMAPVNKCPSMSDCALPGEAGTGYYGGNKPKDNSGVLRYVRVEFGGDKINDEKEFNGITFNGVGSGTLVEYVQIHENNDDGIEFFGGTVNVKYALITGAGDDSVDWTYGYTGKLQFIAAIQSGDADRGIEADNDKSVDKQPRSNPTLSNITLIGVGSEGMKLRRGTGVTITNAVVVGFKKKCVESSTAEAGEVALFNNYFACADLGDATKYANNKVASVSSLKLDGYMPKSGSVLLGAGLIPDNFDFFFDDVNYVGAFGSKNWAEGWTR